MANEDIGTLWFEDPARAAQLVEERTLARARAEYEAEKRQQAFAGAWDSRYPDLADARAQGLTDAVVNRNPALGNLPVSEGMEKLAEKLREMGIGNRERAVMSGGLDDGHTYRPASSDGASHSVTDVLRQRAVARRAAQGKIV